MLVLIQTIKDFREIRNKELERLQKEKDIATETYNKTPKAEQGEPFQAILRAEIQLRDFKQKNILPDFCVLYKENWSKVKIQIGEYKQKQDEVNRCNKKLNKLTGGHSSVVGRWIFADQLRLYYITHKIPNRVADANMKLETAETDKQNYKRTMSLPARVCATCIYGR